jgi:hypothetical protein
MNLPLSKDKLDKILELLKNSSNYKLYERLWTYKMNYLKEDN